MRRRSLFLFQPTKHSKFRESGRDGYQDVLDRPEEMENLVLYHMVTGEEREAQLRMVESVVSDEGNTLAIGGGQS